MGNHPSRSPSTWTSRRTTSSTWVVFLNVCQASRHKERYDLRNLTGKQTEEKKQGVDIACSTKELLTKRWNSVTINAPGYKDLIDMNTGATQDDEAFIMMPANENTTTADAKGYYNAGKIQGQTRQHLEVMNLLGMKQIYTGENKMDCVTAGHEQEWCDETLSDLKQMFNVRFFFCEISLCTAATVELRTLCNSGEGNPDHHHVSFSGTDLLFVDIKTTPSLDRSVSVIFLLGVAGPGNSSVHEKIQVRRLHLHVYHRGEWEEHQ